MMTNLQSLTLFSLFLNLSSTPEVKITKSVNKSGEEVTEKVLVEDEIGVCPEEPSMYEWQREVRNDRGHVQWRSPQSLEALV